MQQKASNNNKTVSKELYIEMYKDSLQRMKKMTFLQFGFILFSYYNNNNSNNNNDNGDSLASVARKQVKSELEEASLTVFHRCCWWVWLPEAPVWF